MADHQHHQHHQHPPHDSTTGWTEKNRAHWDKVAATYNSPEQQRQFGDLINKITSFILQNINWIGVPFVDPSSKFEGPRTSKSVRVLDYACGPGTVTAALAGYATEYVGIDLSENMVAEFNKRFANNSSGDGDGDDQSVPSEKLNAHAVVGDLLDPAGVPPHLQDEKYFNFDMAAVSGGFHHFEHVELATTRLAERLKPGGVLMIFDFLSHASNDIHDNPALQTIVHHGFDEATVQKLFERAGLREIEIKVMPEKVKIQDKAWRTGFLARGRKPE